MVCKFTVNPEDMRFCSERDLPVSRDGVYLFCNYVTQHEQRLFDGFVALLAGDIDESVHLRLLDFMQGQGDGDGLRTRLVKALEESGAATKIARKSSTPARHGWSSVLRTLPRAMSWTSCCANATRCWSSSTRLMDATRVL